MQSIHRLILGFLLSGLATLPASAGEELPLSLEAARHQALEHNLRLEAARRSVDEARAAHLQSLSGYLPRLSLSEQLVRSNDAVSAFGFKLKQERFTQADFGLDILNEPKAITNFQTSIEIRQPVFNGGRALYGRRRAAAGLRAAAARLSRSRQEVTLNTTRAYWGLVLAREALKAVRQALETARAHTASARAHYRQQTVPLTDVLAAQVRVAELKSEEIAAAHRLDEATDELSLVLGLATEVRPVPVDTLVQRPFASALPELVAAALAARPDLKAMAEQSEAERQGVRLERVAYLPHLNAFARIDLDAGEPFDRQGESWSAGATLSWNLFSGLERIGAVQQARARLARSKAQGALLKQEIERQVRRAFRAVQAARAQVEVAAEGLEQARERLRLSQLQYEEELIAATDLLDAETALTQARLRRLEALHAFDLGLAQLEFAVGRGIE